MELIGTVIEESTGRVLRATFTEELAKGEVLVSELCTEAFIEAFFDFKTRTFYGEPLIVEE